MSSILKKVEDRYLNDALFYQVVRALEDLMERAQMTPSEIREAATYAAMRVEMYHPRTFHLSEEDAQRIKSRIDELKMDRTFIPTPPEV